MKSLLAKIGTAVVVVIVLGFVIDTGSVVPPDNTVVYVDPDVEFYYPPTRTPDNEGFRATAYVLAKEMGAKPDNPSGFNIDGPPFLIDLLLSAGVISYWPSYWYGTSVALEFYSEEVIERARSE